MGPPTGAELGTPGIDYIAISIVKYSSAGRYHIVEHFQNLSYIFVSKYTCNKSEI